MAGLKVVPIKTLQDGSLDLADLRSKAETHKDNLAAFMVSQITCQHLQYSYPLRQITYPSTYGVFEDGVQEACKIIHDFGGQVYLDGE